MDGDASRDARSMVITVAVAALLAAAAAAVAPSTWPVGDGRIEVTRPDGRSAAAAVLVGAAEPVDLALDDADVQIALPGGLPVEGTIEAVVTARDGTDLRVADVAVLLRLPDGAVEPLPVVGLASGQPAALLARRQPPAHARVVLPLLAVVASFWVSGTLPLHVPSLAVPVVLAATGARSAEESLAPFFHPIIALFFAGYLMAEALRRAGLDARIATAVLVRSARGPGTVFAAVLALAAGLSMVMSNTAAVAVLLPIALAVGEPLGERRFTRTLVLGLAYAATIGGVGSVIGTPANPLARDFLEQAGAPPISFAGWFAIGVPYLLVFLPMMGLVLWRSGRVTVDPAALQRARQAARQVQAERGPLTRDEGIVAAVLAVVVAVWLAEPLHGISTGIVALGGAVALAVMGRIETADLGRISWSSLLTFGGGLALGLALTDSGVADWVATRLDVLTMLPSGLAVAAVAAVALLTTTVASNTAAAAIMIPIAIPLAAVVGVSPTLLVIVVALASSIDFALVIGTPPTMLAFSTGLFTPREILRRGAPLDLLGLLVLVVVMPPVWDLLGAV